MLTLLAGTHRFCDGISRRSFLRLGALAMGGLSMPSLLRAEQQRGQSSLSRRDSDRSASNLLPVWQRGQ